MTEDAFRKAIKNMRNNGSRLERAGDYWSDDERELLKQMADEGAGISESALLLQRTEPAVCQQMEKLDLFHRKERSHRQKNDNKSYNCRCSSCKVDKQHCPRFIEEQQKGRRSDA